LVAIEGSVPELVDPPPMCRFHTRCPYAAPACGSFAPPLKERSGRQSAACLLYDDASELGVDASEMPSAPGRGPGSVR
jgi:hypothetical protein